MYIAGTKTDQSLENLFVTVGIHKFEQGLPVLKYVDEKIFFEKVFDGLVLRDVQMPGDVRRDLLVVVLSRKLLVYKITENGANLEFFKEVQVWNVGKFTR